MSDPSSQPTQPLTDEEMEAYAALVEVEIPGAWSRSERNALIAHYITAARRLLPEVSRLRVELDFMTRFAEDLREERDRRLRSEGERGVERDALAAKIEATAELHPAWFCETCNSPGPCLTRIRLGLDQDGRGQTNGAA